MKRYWYSILLVCSLVVLLLANTAPAVVDGLSGFAQPAGAPETGEDGQGDIQEENQEDIQEAVQSDNPADSQETGQSDNREESQEAVQADNQEAGRSDSQEGGQEAGQADRPEDGQKEAAGQEEAQTPTHAPLRLSDDFSGVLFIGDSRTVGLSEYGNLGQAEVFASSGMSVFNLFDSQVKMKDQQKKTLEQVFSERQFDTIFFMLGINEMGYEYSAIVKGYQKAVDRVRELQPEAVLVLEANLHVTEEKSSKSPVYNNERIEALNQDIRKMAEARGDHFIDVNEVFDDGKGNMASQFSSDGAHVLGKYYSVWVDWIRQQVTQ